MNSVDTNILVRLLTKDDANQYRKSLRLFKTKAITISETVILETEWVLRYAYSFQTTQICDAFRKLFGLPNVHIKNPTKVAQAIVWHENGLDFADAMHLAAVQDHDRFYTFDVKFVKKAKGLCHCTVSAP